MTILSETNKKKKRKMSILNETERIHKIIIQIKLYRVRQRKSLVCRVLLHSLARALPTSIAMKRYTPTNGSQHSWQHGVVVTMRSRVQTRHLLGDFRP